MNAVHPGGEFGADLVGEIDCGEPVDSFALRIHRSPLGERDVFAEFREPVAVFGR